jgi:Cys-tRNA(Pro)/Cys-tRNA(Cys) deacylase
MRHDGIMSRGGTPAIVELEAAGVHFAVHVFEAREHQPGAGNYGIVAAEAIGADPERVFKTLVANVEGLPGEAQVVAIVPVSGQLSLRALALAVGAKRAEMCPSAVAERLTGYVVGGISPFGQRKRLRTVVDETAILFETIFVSGGKRGLDLELAGDDVIAVLGGTYAPIAG